LQLFINKFSNQIDPLPEEVANSAAKMYDLRSTLLHTGWLEPQKLGKATSDTKRIVERILQALFAKKAGKSEGDDV